jgi:FkbM family methyltransferase
MVIEPVRGYVEKTLFFGNGVMEPRETRVFMEHIGPAGVVVDVGAHIGYYTLIAAKHARKVFAFEPFPENARRLRKNIGINGFRNIVVEEKAVSSTAKPIRVDFENKEMTVSSVTLDEYFDGQRIDMIKIDVDGAELEVLEGAKQVLETNENIKVLMELNITELKNKEPALTHMLEYLKAAGFRFFSLNEQDMPDGNPKETTSEEILSWEHRYFYSLFCKR